MRHTNIVFVLFLTMAQLCAVGYVSAQEFPNYSVHVVLNEQTGNGSTFPVLMELPAKDIFRASSSSDVISDFRCLYALSIGDVRKDLELSAKQEKAARKVFEKLKEQLQDWVIDVHTGESHRTTAYASAAKELRETLDERQRHRLQQLTLQAMAASTDFDEVLADPLWKAIGIELDEEQSTELKERIVELRANLEIEYTIARQKAFEKLIESLPPSERAKARKVIGDPIEGSFAKPAK